MGWFKKTFNVRVALVFCVVLALICGCSSNNSAPNSVNDSPSPDLRKPGVAAGIIDQLSNQAGDVEVVRIRITASTASLTYLDEQSRAHSLIWQDNNISEQNEGTDAVPSSPFNVDDFNLDDVGAMFTQAAKIAGSDQRQELQINEYSAGRALMTVTTTPESATVFFNPDATLIKDLDLTSAEGIQTALAEATTHTPLVLAVGISSEQLWVDVAAGPDVIERRIRPISMPAYYSQRSGSHSTKEFDPALINSQAIANIFASLNTETAASDEDFTADVVINQPLDQQTPLMFFENTSSDFVTTLDGTRINYS